MVGGGAILTMKPSDQVGKAEDAWNAHAESGDWDEDDTLYHAMIAARQTLATDHGIPLPGEGVEG